MKNKHEHLIQSATLLRQLAKSDGGNPDFLAVASFLERLAKVYEQRLEKTGNVTEKESPDKTYH